MASASSSSRVYYFADLRTCTVDYGMSLGIARPGLPALHHIEFAGRCHSRGLRQGFAEDESSSSMEKKGDLESVHLGHPDEEKKSRVGTSEGTKENGLVIFTSCLGLISSEAGIGAVLYRYRVAFSAPHPHKPSTDLKTKIGIRSVAELFDTAGTAGHPGTRNQVTKQPL